MSCRQVQLIGAEPGWRVVVRLSLAPKRRQEVICPVIAWSLCQDEWGDDLRFIHAVVVIPGHRDPGCVGELEEHYGEECGPQLLGPDEEPWR